MENGDRWIMEIQAQVGGNKRPVKMPVSADTFIPVKAMGTDGTIYEIRSIPPDGCGSGVKGATLDGKFVHLNALDRANQLAIKSVSDVGSPDEVRG